MTESLLEILRRVVADERGLIRRAQITAAPLETISGVRESEQRIVLYLYRVEQSRDLKNQGPDYVTVPSEDGMTPAVRVRRDPLALDLHYLLVPFSGNDDYIETHVLLGAAAQAFHDRGIFAPGELGIADLVEPEPTLRLRLSLEALTLDELAKVWEAVQEPYRLSVSYAVRTVQIASRDESIVPRVTTRRVLLGQDVE